MCCCYLGIIVLFLGYCVVLLFGHIVQSQYFGTVWWYYMATKVQLFGYCMRVMFEHNIEELFGCYTVLFSIVVLFGQCLVLLFR